MKDSMIFQLEHIEQMRKGEKTQTRRWSEKVPTTLLYNRYKIGQLYAVQEGRGKPGLKDIKIRVVRKWIDVSGYNYSIINLVGYTNIRDIPIYKEDAQAEGRYNPESYEVEFKRLNKKWDGKDRVGLEFEVVRK